MAYDYDKLYRDSPDALGAPTDIFVRFFRDLGDKRKSVLDIGCGQGRDALFIARLGHKVTGVDLSPHGIRDLNRAAHAEGLPVEGIVADICDFVPRDRYDILLFDRTLHMLDRDQRIAVLDRLLGRVLPGGLVLIADEASNIPDFEAVLADRAEPWHITLRKRGYLFAARAD